MKKIAFLLAIVTLTTTSCEYLRKKGIIGSKKKSKDEQIAELQNARMDDSIKFATQLESLKKDAESKIDSLQKSCGVTGKYHVITGSFLNPVNAENFNKEMTQKGYRSSIIVASNGFHLVSAYSGDNYNEVLNALSNLRTAVAQDEWLYLSN